MRNIIVVEAISTGANFIRDIVNRNYNPIILNTRIEETEDNQAYMEMHRIAKEKIDFDAEIITEKERL